jgi:hypothetical protein
VAPFSQAFACTSVVGVWAAAPTARQLRAPDALMQALDALNRRFGKGMVGLASSRHHGARKPRAGRQVYGPPRYATGL